MSYIFPLRTQLASPINSSATTANALATPPTAMATWTAAIGPTSWTAPNIFVSAVQTFHPFVYSCNSYHWSQYVTFVLLSPRFLLYSKFSINVAPKKKKTVTKNQQKKKTKEILTTTTTTTTVLVPHLCSGARTVRAFPSTWNATEWSIVRLTSAMSWTAMIWTRCVSGVIY